MFWECQSPIEKKLLINRVPSMSPHLLVKRRSPFLISALGRSKRAFATIEKIPGNRSILRAEFAHENP